jgi:hypothetical protein
MSYAKTSIIEVSIIGFATSSYRHTAIFPGTDPQCSIGSHTDHGRILATVSKYQPQQLYRECAEIALHSWALRP